MAAPDSFPRRNARTRRFTLGRPRDVTVSADGRRVVFLRSPAGDDPRTCLWALDLATGAERLVADPADLLASAEEQLPPEERARRERSREQAAGIVGYACDRAARVAAFPLSGRAWVADLDGSGARPLTDDTGVVDPRPDPTGRRVAYVRGGALTVVDLAGGPPRVLAEDPDPEVTWGLADFVAAEEMDRLRGFWWAPDGERLLAARVDERPVQRWWIADPSRPDREPAAVRYPAAGTANADVSLALVGLDGDRVDVGWDRAALPYLAAVSWSAGQLPLVAVQSRDQRRLVVLEVDERTGATRRVAELTDPHWVDLVPGTPARTADGRLVTVAVVAGARRLLVGGEPLTPDGLHVRAVVRADTDVVFTATDEDAPTEVHAWRWSPDGLARLSTEPGVHGAAAGGGTTVLASATMAEDGLRHAVLVGGERRAELASRAAEPGLEPRVRMLTVGPRALRVGVLLPAGHRPGERLPVLLDPYGGPHAQRVLSARGSWYVPQWLADQGFAVVVADGRGTPGRGPAWERAVAGDLAGPPLEDQVDALHGAAEQVPELDLSRVGIRGWSFGGYLSTLAVLRRPDVFHAAVAGAPVADWRLYDTHYTERYLGDPARAGDTYARCSLLDDARRLDRPLLLVHGLADDNVVVAHTLRLSQALLEAGRPHTVLPLSGVTHMTPQEAVAENLLLLQVEFLRRALSA